jgi:hypothetical protein
MTIAAGAFTNLFCHRNPALNRCWPWGTAFEEALHGTPGCSTNGFGIPSKEPLFSLGWISGWLGW